MDKIIAWAVIAIIAIGVLWLGWLAIGVHERLKKAIQELKEEIEHHEK